MDFRILGPLEVLDGDRRCALGGAKQRALLALLLLHANEVVSQRPAGRRAVGRRRARERLKALQVAVSRLARRSSRTARTRTGVLVTRPPGYELRVEPGQLDLHRFEQLVAEGRAALAAGDPAAGRPSCARRSRCGAARRWPTSPTSRSPRRRSPAGGAARSRRSRSGSRPTSSSAGTPSWWASSRALVAEHRCASGCGPADARALPLGPAGGGARGLPGRAARPGRRARDRARPRAAGARAGDPAPGPALDLEAGRRRVRAPQQPRGAFVGREAELARAARGLDDAARRPRDASSCSPASRASARAGSPRSWWRGRGRAARACSSAAAGRRAARPPTGPGCRRSAATSRERDPDALRAGARRRRRATLAQLLPELRERLPRAPAAASARARGGALPPVRCRGARSSRGRRRATDRAGARRPARRRRALAAAAAVRRARDRWRQPPARASAPTATSTRPSATRSQRRWPRAGRRSGRRGELSSAGWPSGCGASTSG